MSGTRAHSSAPLELDFGKLDGLLAVVTQDAESRDVLMVAFMNREAWQKSVETGYAHYFSRSRQCLWKKGETSGHLQRIREIRVDCDQDSVLLLVEQQGVCCHTGNRTCFYRSFRDGALYPVDEGRGNSR